MNVASAGNVTASIMYHYVSGLLKHLSCSDEHCCWELRKVQMYGIVSEGLFQHLWHLHTKEKPLRLLQVRQTQKKRPAELVSMLHLRCVIILVIAVSNACKMTWYSCFV